MFRSLIKGALNDIDIYNFASVSFSCFTLSPLLLVKDGRKGVGWGEQEFIKVMLMGEFFF